MRKLILMTSAAVIVPLSSFAGDITCTATPNCADLGYTSTTSCDKGVKCPWGEAWYCPPEYPEVCEIGSILYSDMTCYKEAQAGKTPIGVVVYVDGLGAGQAMALNSLDTIYVWSTEHKDIPDLQNYSTTSEASQDYASCENSKIIMATGDKSKYPAAWVAHEYSTEGTSAGDWCLPAAGIFTSYYNNQTSVNLGFERVNGTKFTTSTYAWSSSEDSNKHAWYSHFNYSYGLYSNYYKYSYTEVRPVFEFVQTFEGMCKASQQYTCKGENETGGVGDVCAGKYSECSCTEGYVWWQGKCIEDKVRWGQCTGLAQNCAVGDILFSDGTCASDVVDGKTAIAVVVYKSDDGKCGQALALKSLASKYRWSTEYVDISGLPNLEPSEASKDYASCENSKIIMAAGDKNTYPAAWAVNEYNTEGTSAGDWCLPAAGIFTSYYNNQTSVNLGFERVNGTKFTISTYAWSSSEHNETIAWYSVFDYSNGVDNYYGSKGSNYEVRPVLEF